MSEDNYLKNQIDKLSDSDWPEWLRNSSGENAALNAPYISKREDVMKKLHAHKDMVDALKSIDEASRYGGNPEYLGDIAKNTLIKHGLS